MIQILLKNTVGIVTHTINSLEELSKVLNDPMILSQQNLSSLLIYLLNNHYRARINGVDYYMSNQSFGMNQPITIVFSELDLPQQSKQLKLVLEDQSENVLYERELSLKEFAYMLNDQQILNSGNEALLEIYIMSHHMRTTINGDLYRHKGVNWSIYHHPIYTFVKL